MLTLAEVQLRLDFHALLHRQLQVDGLVLRQGKFLWPVSPTNTLKLDNIQTELRFQTNDTWSLDNFQADFAGAKLELSGERRPRAGNPRLGDVSRHRLGQFSGLCRRNCKNFPTTLDRIHFDGTPQLSLTVTATRGTSIRLSSG